MREYRVEDHAWRLWRARGGNAAELPPAFVNALEIAARDHMAMQAAIQPYHRRGDLEDRERARGLSVRGLREPLPRGLARRAEGHHHLPAEQRARRGAVGRARTRRRTSTSPSPTGASASPTRRRWRSRRCAGRTGRSSPPARRPGPTWSRRRGTASRSSSAMSRTARAQPFEVWVNGEQTPRGLAALAKNLSMDMRAQDRAWLKLKLDSLAKTPGAPVHRGDAARRPRRCRSPATSAPSPGGASTAARRSASSTAPEGETPLVDAMFSRKEPKSGVDGTLSLDRRHPEPGDRRRLRDVRQGMRAARRHQAAVQRLAVGRLPARVQRPDQVAQPRHAGDRPGLDRQEAARAEGPARGAGRLLRPRARARRSRRCSPRRSPTWRGC